MCVEELLKTIYNMSISCQLIFIDSPNKLYTNPLPSIYLGEMDIERCEKSLFTKR